MGKQKITPSRSKKRWLLAVIALLFALALLKIALTLTAKPKITVDYVAEYNRITRPQNYDPNNNAAPYYQKAFDAFSEMPPELHNPYINWPPDFNTAEQTILENWLTSDSNAFEYFKIASNKPFYWLERQTQKKNDMFHIKFSEISSLGYLTKALIWNAKLTASKGRPQIAFENIIDCYRAGCQKCRTPSSVIEQLVGMGLKRTAIDSALVILDKTQVDSSALKSFQNALQVEFDNDIYVPDFWAERLFLYDGLQMSFIDNGRGTGRLAWGLNWHITPYSELDKSPIHTGFVDDLKRSLYYFLIGPNRNQVIEQIERSSALFNQVMTKTPWQLKNENRDYSMDIEKIKKHHFSLEILDIGFSDSYRVLHAFYKTRAQTQALLAVLAILRFKSDNGRLPATLDELVSAGYLQSVPMDPYSDGPLVYKPAGDSFKLYSLGEDFSDDGGSSEVKTKYLPEFGGIHRIHREYTPDLVYWPVKKLKDPRKELSAEQMKKLRAAKEADVFGKTRDPNHSPSGK